MDSRLMVVGDMPRREDDRAGNPFVGQDGQLLRATVGEICNRLGVDPTKVYYTSAVRCRTPQQRPPEQDEIDNCLGWLMEEIGTLQPICILMVGQIAQYITPFACELAELDVALLSAYHPAFILKNKTKLPLWQKQVEEAVRRAFQVASPSPKELERSNLDWTLGTPDMSSPWLSADTEFDTLEEEYATTPVGYSIGDGERADFYAEDGFALGQWPHLYLHNIKADADHLGIDLHDLDSWDDTMLMAYVTREFKYVGLKKLAPELAGVDWPISIKELLREFERAECPDCVGTGYAEDTPVGPVPCRNRGCADGIAVFKSGPRKGQEKPGKWKSVPFSRALAVRPDECRSYAATDALATARIAQRLDPMLDEGDGWARRYYRDFEKPLVPVLLSMERAGVRIDPERLQDAAVVIAEARARTEVSLRDVFGPDINLGSNSQMAPVLADLELIDGKLTESGELGCAKGNILGAFNVEKIEDLPATPEGQIARDLLEWRQMGKLKSTYVDAILARLDSESRVHGRYNQAVTNTNRLSSSDPNLQNIPARSDIGLAIRKAFIPREGSVFVGGDFSQLQLRVWAEFTRDPVFVNAYTQGGERADFHQYAATALGRPRSTIKNFVFCILFGGEEEKAAVTAGLPGSEIRPFIEQMRRDLPSLQTFKRAVSDTLAVRGYVESLMGWRGFFPDALSPVTKWRNAALREATNFPIQATEAGLVKAFMIEVYATLRADYPDFRLVLQVHDELWAEGPREKAAEVAAMMKETAERVAKRWFRTVPIVFDTKIVENWGAAK